MSDRAAISASNRPLVVGTILGPVLPRRILSRYYQCQRQADLRSAARTTIRLLESLIRLAQAHARLMYRKLVTVQDAVVAITCMECSMQNAALLGVTNALHTRFPDDPAEEYSRQAELVLRKLGLEDELQHIDDLEPGNSSERRENYVTLEQKQISSDSDVLDQRNASFEGNEASAAHFSCPNQGVSLRRQSGQTASRILAMSPGSTRATEPCDPLVALGRPANRLGVAENVLDGQHPQSPPMKRLCLRNRPESASNSMARESARPVDVDRCSPSGVEPTELEIITTTAENSSCARTDAETGGSSVGSDNTNKGLELFKLFKKPRETALPLSRASQSEGQRITSNGFGQRSSIFVTEELTDEDLGLDDVTSSAIFKWNVKEMGIGRRTLGLSSAEHRMTGDIGAVSNILFSCTDVLRIFVLQWWWCNGCSCCMIYASTKPWRSSSSPGATVMVRRVTMDDFMSESWRLNRQKSGSQRIGLLAGENWAWVPRGQSPRGSH